MIDPKATAMSDFNGGRCSRREALWAGLLSALSGCGYTLGNGFPAEIRTISVPMFRNESYRRNIEFQLTEAVQKEIQDRTPFILAKADQADTQLLGTIMQVRKDVLGENKFDDPRELQYSVMVRVEWKDLRTNQLLGTDESPLTPDALPAVGQAEFAPEVGHSLATATQDSVNRLAKKIVNMMEASW